MYIHISKFVTVCRYVENGIVYDTRECAPSPCLPDAFLLLILFVFVAFFYNVLLIISIRWGCFACKILFLISSNILGVVIYIITVKAYIGFKCIFWWEIFCFYSFAYDMWYIQLVITNKKITLVNKIVNFFLLFENSYQILNVLRPLNINMGKKKIAMSATWKHILP